MPQDPADVGEWVAQQPRHASPLEASPVVVGATLPEELTKGPPPPPRTPAVLRAVLILAACALSVLLVSGAWLAGWYGTGSSSQDTIESLHVIAGWALVGLLVVAFAITLLPSATASSILPVTAIVASVAGLLSGAQLKWDSLQLRAVRTGIDLEGFRWLLDRDTPVRAAEVGDEVMSLNELRAWTGGHIAMGVIALALVVGARWTRPQPRGGTVPWTTRRH